MVLALPANPHYLPVFRAVTYPRPVILVLTEEPVLVIPELESTHAQARSHVRDIRTYSDLGLGGLGGWGGRVPRPGAAGVWWSRATPAASAPRRSPSWPRGTRQCCARRRSASRRTRSPRVPVPSPGRRPCCRTLSPAAGHCARAPV